MLHDRFTAIIEESCRFSLFSHLNSLTLHSFEHVKLKVNLCDRRCRVCLRTVCLFLHFYFTRNCISGCSHQLEYRCLELNVVPLLPCFISSECNLCNFCWLLSMSAFGYDGSSRCHFLLTKFFSLHSIVTTFRYSSKQTLVCQTALLEFTVCLFAH